LDEIKEVEVPKPAPTLSNKFVRMTMKDSSVFSFGEVVFVAGHCFTPDSQEMDDSGWASKKWGVNKVEDGAVVTATMYTVPFKSVEALPEEENKEYWGVFREIIKQREEEKSNG